MKASSAPPNVSGHGAEQMKLICYAVLTAEQRRIAGDSLAGPGPREEYGKAVYEGNGGFYLFTCDSQWKVMFDSWHQTREEAERQANFEYQGIKLIEVK